MVLEDVPSTELPSPVEKLPVKNAPNQNSGGSLIDSLKSNQFFAAGFGLVGIGALLSILKKSSSAGYTIMRKTCTISLEVVSKDPSYNWLLKWINNHLKDKSQHISVNTFFSKNKENSRVSTYYSFVPSVGIHYFKYKNRWIRAERTREQVVDRNTGSPVETLSLITVGRDINLFHSILEQARQKELKENVGKTIIYRAGLGNSLL